MKQYLSYYFTFILIKILFNQLVMGYHIIGSWYIPVLILDRILSIYGLILIIHCGYLFIKEIARIKVDNNGRITRKNQKA